MENIFGNPENTPENQNSQVTPDQSKQQDSKPAEDQVQKDPYADLLSKIQSDDGRQKYADVPTALESITHAQGHIKDLTTKVKELEDKLRDASNVEDILKRVESKQADNAGQPSTEALDETKIAQMLDQQLTKREQETVRKANQQEVVKSLVETFGEKAEEVYNAKAEELGMDLATLNELSRRSPKAVLAYFGSQSKGSTGGFSQSSVNTAAMGNMAKEKRDPADRYKPGETDLMKKWRDATSDIEG